MATLGEGRRRRIVKSEVPQKALKIVAYEDIHGGAQSFLHAGRVSSVKGGERRGFIRRGMGYSMFFVRACFPEAVQDIIGICGYYKL